MHVLFSSVALLPTLILGFGQEKSVDYFMDNQDEISVTLEKCETSLEYAVKAKDEERFKEVLESLECKHAQQARANIRQQQRIVEQKEREKKAEKFDADKQKFSSYLKSLDLLELKKEAYRLANECSSTFAGGFKYSFECAAFSEQKKQIDRILIKDIVNTDSYSDIKTYVASDECSKNPFNPSYVCVLNKAALKESYKKAVDELSKDKSLVSHSYNQCVDTYLKLRKEKGYKDARNAVKTDSCRVAKGAVKKLSLLKSTQMNFKTKIQ